MSEEIENVSPDSKDDLVGIRGWLWYFCAGLVISVPIYLYNAYTYFNMVSDYSSFNRGWVVISIAVSDVAIAAAFGYSFFLIIKRKKLGRDVLFFSLIASALFAVLSIALLDQTYSGLVSQKLITAADKQSAVDTYPNEFGRPILYSIVWAVYFRRSNRVKATLTN